MRLTPAGLAARVGDAVCAQTVVMAGGNVALEKKKQNRMKPFSPSIANEEPSLSEAGCSFVQSVHYNVCMLSL